ncbi:NAD(P)-dependent alcohol dehydrogenase [Leifsonia shinshuensis]|uniref:NAD(P)-dependent alcohol dehydrogenase n=1 Tax=Leifsonia shinshuensis TaxID=150026 RepID=UPI001F5149C9|nr:NAD(P)-dependent alcohol dehydrogenase [Leifsonia shinshuensis]MCI0159018.1 NAD(P)-dependent alcohol dehydrogenase [Leifsonia shinshuensis]
MRAVVQDAYGTTAALRVEEVPVPEAGARDVLVRVRAAGIDAGTWHLTTGRPYLMRAMGFGLRGPRPRVRGLAFAGEVEAVGADVHDLQPGDRVYGAAAGALAEYVRAPRAAVVRIPRGLGFEEAAAVPISAVTALQAVAAAHLEAGDRVLVLGAAGGVGHYAVQLAVARGALVTGVCSGGKLDLVRELGATDAIDYTTTDPLGLGRIWDAIIDIAGSRPLGLLRRSLAPEGALVLVGGESAGSVLGGTERLAAAGLRNATTRQRLIGLMSRERAEDLAELSGLIDTGTVRPVIDTVYPLDRTAEAIDHIGAGRARGKVVVVM